MSQKKYTSKQGVEVQTYDVNVDKIEYLERKEQTQPSYQKPIYIPPIQQPLFDNDFGISDDDIPF